MAKRDLNELYDLVAKLRDEYDVIIEIWSIDDVEAVISDRNPDMSQEDVQSNAEKVWPTVAESFGEATVPYGHEVIEFIITGLEGDL